MKGNCRRKVMTTGKKSLGTESETERLDHKQCVPKEIEEPKRLHYHTNEGPFEKHEQNAAKKTDSSTQFLFPGEKVESFLRSYDKCEA